MGGQKYFSRDAMVVYINIVLLTSLRENAGAIFIYLHTSQSGFTFVSTVVQGSLHNVLLLTPDGLTRLARQDQAAPNRPNSQFFDMRSQRVPRSELDNI